MTSHQCTTLVSANAVSGDEASSLCLASLLLGDLLLFLSFEWGPSLCQQSARHGDEDDHGLGSRSHLVSEMISDKHPGQSAAIWHVVACAQRHDDEN